MGAGAKLTGRKRAADATLDADGAAAIASSFKAKRTKPATKRMYSSKMSVMLEWIRNKFPALIAPGSEDCRLPLPKDAVLGFFGHLVQPAHECDTKNVHDVESPPLSVSCVEGYRSALVDLYRTSALEIEPAIDKELKETLDGYLKTINDLKLRGLMDINEGKRYLKWAGYDLLSTKLMKLTPTAKGQKWPTGIFAWSFLVLMWNLMSRSDSVDKIMLQHIDWSEDALIIEEQGHKGDQTGADKFGKHIYANPFEPAKCPVLALAVQLFSCPERTSGRHQLFVGSDSKGRFVHIIQYTDSRGGASNIPTWNIDIVDSTMHDAAGLLLCQAEPWLERLLGDPTEYTLARTGCVDALVTVALSFNVGNAFATDRLVESAPFATSLRNVRETIDVFYLLSALDPVLVAKYGKRNPTAQEILARRVLSHGGAFQLEVTLVAPGLKTTALLEQRLGRFFIETLNQERSTTRPLCLYAESSNDTGRGEVRMATAPRGASYSAALVGYSDLDARHAGLRSGRQHAKSCRLYSVHMCHRFGATRAQRAKVIFPC